MKKLLYLTALIITASPLFSQETAGNTTKGFIGINGGLACLNGKITTSNYNDPASGYSAAAGAVFGVDGAWFFSKHIGVGGVLSGTGFSCKGLQALSDGYKEDFDVDSCTVYAKGRYSTVNLLVGPYFTFPVNKWSFDVRLLGGLVMAKTPQFRVDLEDQSAATFYQQSAKATAFGWQAGAGIRYSVTPHLCLKLNGDFFYSKPDFSIENVNRVVNAGRLIERYNQPFSGFYLTAGLAYQFR